MGVYSQKLSTRVSLLLCGNVKVAVLFTQAFGSSEHRYTEDPRAKLMSLFQLFILLEK